MLLSESKSLAVVVRIPNPVVAVVFVFVEDFWMGAERLLLAATTGEVALGKSSIESSVGTAPPDVPSLPPPEVPSPQEARRNAIVSATNPIPFTTYILDEIIRKSV